MVSSNRTLQRSARISTWVLAKLFLSLVSPHTLIDRLYPSVLSRFAGSDSPESAAKELGQIFEGWDQNWWIEQRRKEL